MSKSFIQTVRGPISPDQLGTTLMHEHLTVDWAWALGYEDKRIETVAVVNRVLQCLKKAHEAGITALVDAATEQFSPSPLFFLCVAAQTPVHIISSTGCFAEDMLPTPSWAFPPAGPEEIAQRFIAAATEGRSGSGVKPGIIKIATSAQAITDIERNVFKAAALAQRATGLPITTHAMLSRFPEEQVDMLEEAGADLDRVVIGHFGWGSTIKDSAMHHRVAKRGVTLGIDVVGSPARTLEENAEIAFDLIEAGFSSRIIFSHDGAAYSRGMLETFGAGWLSGDFTIVSKQLLPLLRKKGVDERTLEGIMNDNPRKILTIDPERYPGARDTLLHQKEADPLAPYDYNTRQRQIANRV